VGRRLTNAREVDLAAYLRRVGFDLEAKGKANWRVVGHDGLTVRGSHWREFRAGGRGRVGNSLDFLVTMLGLDPQTAARDLLVGYDGAGDAGEFPVPPPGSPDRVPAPDTG
jgi:hypothetical protein